MMSKERLQVFLKSNLVVFVVYLIVGACIYSNSLKAPYYLDDNSRIVKNPHIRITNFNVDTIVKAATTRPSSPMRPVGNLSFALNYYLHRYKVAGYHLVNIAIHIAAGCFLFLFIHATLMRFPSGFADVSARLVAFTAALLWLVHPVNTQSVTYIVQRYNSLAALFSILALWLYVRGRTADEARSKRLWLAGAAISWLLALGSKQTAAILPFIVFLYEWFFFNDLSWKWFQRKLRFLAVILAAFVLIAFVYMGTKPLQKASSINDFAKGKFTYAQRLYTQPRVLVHYMTQFFFPHPSRLNLEHDFPLSDSLFDPPKTFFSLLFLAGLLGFAVVFARSQRLISFCILWFFGSLAIESSFIPLAIIFEHRTYMPFMLFSLLVVIVLFQLIKNRMIVLTIWGVSVLAFSWWTYQRNSTWTDEIVFWKDAIAKAPQNVRPVINLGAALINEGKTDEAIEYMQKALQMNPDEQSAYEILGFAHAEQGKANEAIQYYDKALEKKQNKADVYLKKADALVEIGRTDEALKNYKESLRLKPELAATYLNFGALQVKQGKLDQALEHYRNALKYAPHSALAHYNIAKVMEKKGREDEAVSAYLEAIDLNPELGMAYSGLAGIREKNGEIDQAFELYQKALQINPEALISYNNMGNIYAKQGDFNKAIEQFKKALDIDPDYALAYKNLADVYTKLGRLSQAKTHYESALALDSELLEAHNNFGNLLLQMGDLEGAIAQFNAALAVDPEYSAAEENLKKALVLKQELRDSIADLKQSLQASPGDETLHFDLANLYAGSGELEKSVIHYKKAVALRPDFREALANMALVYAIHEEYADSLGVYQQMHARWPEDPTVAYNIACIHSRMEKLDQSLAWLKKAVALGYDDWDKIRSDPDLANLRRTELFEDFIKDRPS